MLLLSVPRMMVEPSREIARAWTFSPESFLSQVRFPFPSYIRTRLLVAVTKEDPSRSTAIRSMGIVVSDQTGKSLESRISASLFVVAVRGTDSMLTD